MVTEKKSTRKRDRRSSPKTKPPAAQVIESEIAAVQAALSSDLLTRSWRIKNEESGNPLVGHCYVAAEALFHRLGGKRRGWKSFVLTHSAWPEGLDVGETHWFLRHESGAIGDPTALQYEGQPIAYDRGIACGFLTKNPSKRARIVLQRL